MTTGCRHSWRATAAALAWMTLFSGCAVASHRGDALFDAGDYPGAAAAYEAENARGVQPAKTLFRLGVAYATPGSAVSNPAKAAEAFARLRATYPGSAYATQAALPMALLAQVLEADKERERLAAEVKARQAQLESAGEESSAIREERDRQRAALAQLKSRIAEQEATIARLKHELEQLKRIDLAPQR